MEQWRLPPELNRRLIEAPKPPLLYASPTGTHVLLLEQATVVDLDLLARPHLGLAGVRVWPDLHCTARAFQNLAAAVVEVATGVSAKLNLPSKAFFGARWAPDGRFVALQVEQGGGIALWIADARTGESAPVPGLRLNNVAWGGDAFFWWGETLVVASVPEGFAEAPRHLVPMGPSVQEAAGRKSQMRTYQNLLRTPADADLFSHFSMVQLCFVDAVSHRFERVGSPSLLAHVQGSPDETLLAVRRIEKPFSLRVPVHYFAQSFEVWDRAGNPVATVARRAIQDEVPRDGVPLGPRFFGWDPHRPATLTWAEAQDGGDPVRPAEHRDFLFKTSFPFQHEKIVFHRLRHRLQGLVWLDRPDWLCTVEYERDRRWQTTTLLDAVAGEARILFERDESDDYGDPGSFVEHFTPTGQRVATMAGSQVFLEGAGASPQGERPFLDSLCLATGEKRRLFWSAEDRSEEFAEFVGEVATRALIWSESPSEPRNLYLLDLGTGARRPLTSVVPPAPDLGRIRSEIVSYRRADGLLLSATLLLPPDWDGRTPLSTVIWAYPREYSSEVASQVRANPRRYPWPTPVGPIHFALQGYAVLLDAAMPVVGSPEIANDTFLEQISSSAKAAVDFLVDSGIAHRDRIVVAGHSYGAFMVANLLAHTSLFAAGIARSGAYNRTLTPFGFQGERRSYWEVPELYAKMSPFHSAGGIKAPLLLIHGANDSNSGTYPEQSERLFQAISGLGGVVRLVMLPFEEHAYRGRETCLHVVAEMLEWASRHTK